LSQNVKDRFAKGFMCQWETHSMRLYGVGNESITRFPTVGAKNLSPLLS
jgi:hypothetical protein